MRALKDRHPYITAEQAFTAGRITVAQAVAMICRDREYIAECELTGKDKSRNAETIVRDIWAPVLVRNIQEANRNANA
ncbi:hypothetical protein [Bradyrhizobium sp. USDA 4350]